MADGSVKIAFEQQDSGLDAAINKTKKGIEDLSTTAKSTTSKMAGSFKSAASSITSEMASFATKNALAIGGSLVAGLTAGIKNAGELQAINAQFSQVFDGVEAAAEKNINGIAKQAGMLSSRLKAPYTQATSMFKGLGLSTSDAMKQATTATTAAADAAAFYDKSYEEANSSLNSFVKGNYEGGEAIGLFSSETQMANKAVSAGLVKQSKDWTNLTEAQKQVFRLKVATEMQKSSGALGQASREADGLENVLGNLKQSVFNLTAAFGQPFLAPFISLAKNASAAMEKLASAMFENPAAVQAVVIALAGLAAAFGAVAIVGKFSSIIAALKVGFLTVTNPIFLVVAGIGLLVAALFYAYNTFKPFADLVNKIGAALAGGLKSGAEFAAEALNKLITAAKPLATALGGKITTALAWLKTTLVALADIGGSKAVAMFKQLTSTVSGGLSAGLTKISAALAVVVPKLQQLGGAAKSGAVAAFEKLKAVFSSFNIDAVAIVGVITSIIMAISGLTGPVGFAIGLITKFLTAFSITGNAGTAFQSVVDGITGTITTISSILPGIITTITGVLTKIITAITGALPSIISAITSALVGVITAITGILPQIIQAGTQIITGLLTAILTALPQLITAGVEIVTGLLTAILSALPQIIQAGTQIINGIVTAIVAALPQLVTAGTQIISGLTSALTTALPLLITAGLELVTGLLGAIVAALPLLIDAALQIITALANGFITNLPAIVAAGIQLLTALVGALVTALPLLIDAALQIITALVNGLIAVLPSLITAAIQIIMALVNGLIAMLPQIIAAAIQIITALINGLIAALPQIIAAGIQLITALVGAVIQLAPTLLSAGLQLIGALISGALSLIGSLIAAGAQLVGSLLSRIVGFAGQMLSAGAKLISSIANGLGQGISGAVGKIADLGRQIVAKAGGFAGELVNAGSNLVAGFARGIADGATKAVRAAADMAKGAVDSVKNALGIHSPSRVFRDEVGRYVPEGVAVGIEANTDSVSAAMQSLKTLMTDDYSAAAIIGDGKTNLAQRVKIESEKTTATDENKKLLEQAIEAMDKFASQELGIIMDGKAVVKTIRGDLQQALTDAESRNKQLGRA